MFRNALPVLALIAVSAPLCAQVSTGGLPYGLRAGLGLAQVPVVHAAPFDAERVAADDARRQAEGKVPAYARVQQVAAGLGQGGQWTELPNGDRLWRAELVSDGALATELYFSDFRLPENASLYVYSPDGAQVLGGFTAYNNSEEGTFATSQMAGEACILEYYEPAAVAGIGRVQVSGIGHAYRWVEGAADAGACEVDVNCSEGDNWHPQRDAVVRISITDGQAMYWCSGTLVNNLAQDCKPYFLTAQHCGEGIAASFYNQWKFYFRYERNGCGASSGSMPGTKTMTGCVKRGSSNDGGGDSGSDFLLLEANTATIPPNYTPFWAGWDATGAVSTGGVCIHHPDGDRKKISTFTGSTASTTWGGVPNTHWRVNWTATAHGAGVTEPGSSGSALFNGAKRIIGTLTGGTSSCASTGSPDYFGKMSYHWQSNPGAANMRLKVFLDPQSTGTLSMDGSYTPCGNPVGIAEEQAVGTTLSVRPNPADDAAVITLPAAMRPGATLEVRDMGGRLVARQAVHTAEVFSLPTASLEEGAYVLVLAVDGRVEATAPLIVAHP